jgi:hypothetical protein
MSYTVEQQENLKAAIRELDRTGFPTHALRINIAIDNDEPFNDIMKIPQEIIPVRPEVPVMDLPEQPPFSGKGSGITPWRVFAKKVSDMEPEVIDDLGRPDLIKILVDKGIISEEG